jgi:hypothetical protein
MKKITFNGRKIETQSDVLDWAAIQRLSGEIQPSVTYKSADKSGALRFGESLALTDGMIITAMNTGAA